MDSWVGPTKATLAKRSQATYLEGDASGSSGLKFEVYDVIEADNSHAGRGLEMAVWTTLTNVSQAPVLVPPQRYWELDFEARIEHQGRTYGANNKLVHHRTITLGHEQMLVLEPGESMDMRFDESGIDEPGRCFIRFNLTSLVEVRVGADAVSTAATVESKLSPEIEIQRAN